jgi:hypothetical protein
MREPVRLARSESRSRSKPGIQGIEAFVPNPPTVVKAGGRDWVYYEVHITNCNDYELKLLRVEILIGDSAVPIEGENLAKLVAAARGITVALGMRSVILIAAVSRMRADAGSHWSDSDCASGGRRGMDCRRGARQQHAPQGRTGRL